MKIAITGSIGSGKSLASTYLRSKGYKVYDTDKMVHTYYDIKGPAYETLIQTFGQGILKEDRTIDRAHLASLVFQDKDKLNQLESIVYPILVKEIQSLDDANEIIFYEVPVLYESGFETYFDKVLMIDADKDIRIERLLERGMSNEDLQRRMLNQMDPKIKVEKADDNIRNNSSIKDLHSALDHYINQLEKEFDHGSI